MFKQLLITVSLSMAGISLAQADDLKTPGASYLFYKLGVYLPDDNDVETAFATTERTVVYENGQALNVGYGWINQNNSRLEIDVTHRKANVETESGSPSNAELEMSQLMMSVYSNVNSPIFFGLGFGVGIASINLSGRAPTLNAEDEGFLSLKGAIGFTKRITDSVDFVVEAEYLVTTQIEMSDTSSTTGRTFNLGNSGTTLLIGARQWF